MADKLVNILEHFISEDSVNCNEYGQARDILRQAEEDLSEYDGLSDDVFQIRKHLVRALRANWLAFDLQEILCNGYSRNASRHQETIETLIAIGTKELNAAMYLTRQERLKFESQDRTDFSWEDFDGGEIK